MKRAAVIMTAHNVAPYIREAIASVRASIKRVPSPWHVDLRIGVDGCPLTAATLEEAGEPYWWSAVNVGCFTMRNSLIWLEAADAYCPFDADDVMCRNYLRAVLAALPATGTAGVAREEVGPLLESAAPPIIKPWKGASGSCAFSHAAWQTLGGYWTEHRGAMDTELMDRAAKARLPWVAVPPPALFLRRRNPTSLTQGPFTRRGTPMRTAAINALAVRKADPVIYEPPVTTPLEWRGTATPDRPPYTVAVVVTAYRVPPDWLRACLASIRASAELLPRDVAVRLRVGVDGCAATASALDADGEPYAWTPENVGTYQLRNSLVTAAPADAYVIFDADDVMLPAFLPSIVRELRQQQMVIAGPDRYDVDPRLKGPIARPYVSGICGLTHDAWTHLGGYRNERYSADTDLIERAALAGVPVQRLRDPKYLRRSHPDSLTKAPATGMVSDARHAAQARMAAARAQDWRNTPVTVPLEWRGRQEGAA